MPKITVHGGPSNAYEPQTSVNEEGNPVTVHAQEPLPVEIEVDTEESTSDYSEFTKDDLVKELKARDLPTSGNKDELVARLEEDDKIEEDGE